MSGRSVEEKTSTSSTDGVPICYRTPENGFAIPTKPRPRSVRPSSTKRKRSSPSPPLKPKKEKIIQILYELQSNLKHLNEYMAGLSRELDFYLYEYENQKEL